jgi:phosphomevalonate kinase
MAETVAKRTYKKIAAEKGRRGRPKDAQDTESRASYYARKYMESQAANTNTRVQSEIDEITRRMIDVEQQLLAEQNANEGFRSLKEELAKLQSERKAKKEHLVFRPMKKTNAKDDLCK